MTLSEDDVKWDGPLPIMLVEDEAGDYVCIEQGDGALERGAAWCGENTDLGPFSVSIHDQRCPHCNRTFWHEAPSGSEETGWHCPLCDALLTTDADGEVYIGTVVARARRSFATEDEQNIRALFVGIKEALEGDSNDDEHDALVAVAEFFVIPWTTP